MFLLAITKDEIAQNFQSVKMEEFNIHGLKITIVTDKFLSDIISEPNGFSLIESPLISSPRYRDIIFSQITFDSEKDILKVFKSTISGRPVYYHFNNKGEFFCSTHINMLRYAGVSIEENSTVLPEFFVYRFVMPPQTLFKDINTLMMGNRLFIKLINNKCKIIHEETYNPFSNCKKESKNIDFITEHARNLLENTFEPLQSYKDRLAILLSGGLDPSILFKLCEKNYDIDTTYSTGYPFEDPKKNIEKEYAQSAAEAFHVNHKYYTGTTKDYLYGFIESISKTEEPIHHHQSVLLYLLFKNGLPKDKDIIVIGEGADTNFSTDLPNSFFQSEKFKILLKLPFFQILKSAFYLSDKGRSLVDMLEMKKVPRQNINNIIWSLGAYGSIDWTSHYFNVERNDIIQGRYKIIKPFENYSIPDVTSIYTFFSDISISQSIWSKLGESQKKIIIYPFTNINLLDYSFSIPWEVKLEQPKYILRNVARQLNIPDFIITRPKSCFGIINDIWSKKDGVLEPLVPLAAKVFDEKEIRRMQSTNPEKANIFWNILNYSIWKRLIINNEDPKVLLKELAETI